MDSILTLLATGETIHEDGIDHEIELSVLKEWAEKAFNKLKWFRDHALCAGVLKDKALEELLTTFPGNQPRGNMPAVVIKFEKPK